MERKKEKNSFLKALAVILAVVLALGGGTYAYLQAETDPVINEFNPNTVDVELEEPSGGDYEIVPGTSQTKDPTITASYTLDSYVYVEVTDATEGLVTWYIANGWTPLDAATDADAGVYVYYMLLKASYGSAGITWTLIDDAGSDYNGWYSYTDSNRVTYYYNAETDQYVAVIPVLEGNKVYYDVDITNEQMEAVVDDLTLDFQAYIIQADLVGTTGETNESALTCWNVLQAGNTANPVSVTVENVEVTTDQTTGVTTTTTEIVVTSEDGAYSATVPAGTVIDTNVADIVTDVNGNTTTTLILVVENVGTGYTDASLTVNMTNVQTAEVYDISIIGVSESNTTVMEVALNIGADLEIASVEHETIQLTESGARLESGSYVDNQYFYNSSSGILYIYTDTFSEFAVVRNVYRSEDGSTEYNSLDKAVEDGYVVVNRVTNVLYTSLRTAANKASENDTIALLADATVPSNDTVNITKSMTIDLNGFDVTQTNTAGGVFRVGTTSGNVTVSIIGNGGTITGGKYGICVPNNTNTVLTVSDVTIKIVYTSTATLTELGGISFISSNTGTSLTVNNVTIDSTSLTKQGAAIYTAAETTTVTNTEIETGFHGIYNAAGMATVEACNILTDNSVNTAIYGIYNEKDATITISGTTVTNTNRAAVYNNGTMTVKENSVFTSSGSSSSFVSVKSSAGAKKSTPLFSGVLYGTHLGDCLTMEEGRLHRMEKCGRLHPSARAALPVNI